MPTKTPALLATLLTVAVVFTAAAPSSAQNADVGISVGGSANESGGEARTALAAAFEYSLTSPDPGPLETESVFTVFRGVRRDAEHGVLFGIDGELAHREGSSGQDTTLFGSQKAALALFGWEISQTLGYQPKTEFADPFWRSTRGMLSGAFAIEVPPMWGVALGRRVFLWACRPRVAYGEVVRRENGALSTKAFDLDITLEGGGLQMAAHDLGLWNFRLREYGVPTSRSGNTTHGVSVTALDFELANLTLNFDSLSLNGIVGIGFRSPVSTFETVSEGGNVSSRSYGDPLITGVGWLSASLAETETRPYAISLGGGLFSRVSPDGFAADRGFRVEVRAATELTRDLSLELAVDVASLRRIVVSDMAPADIAGVGTRFLLAKTGATLSMPIADNIDLSATAYAERTDREDPRRHKSAPNPDEFGFGLDVAATMRLGK